MKGVSGAPKTTWNVELAEEKFMSPALSASVLSSALEATVSDRRDITWTMKSRLTIRGHAPVELEDFGVAIGGMPDTGDWISSRVVRTLGDVLNNPWENVHVDGVQATLELKYERDVLRLRGIDVLDPIVDAGEKARFVLHLRPFAGAEVTRTVEIAIPAELAGRDVEVEVQPGYDVAPDVAPPENLDQLLTNATRSTLRPMSVVVQIKMPTQGVVFLGHVAPRLPSFALDALRPTTSDVAPEVIASWVRAIVTVDQLRRRPRQGQNQSPPEDALRKNNRCVSFVLVMLTMLAFAISRPAGAVGTRTFDLDSLDEFSGGDLDGASVGSDGVVRAGFKLGDVHIADASTIFAALPRADGSVLLGTSPNGKIFKVAGDQSTVFCDTKETAVTSIAEDARGNVYAATMPDGKIFKVSQGKAEPFVTLPDSTYVWALAFDKTKTNLYAAVGLEQGRVFRVNLSGQAEVLFRSDEPHIVSLAVAPNGDVLAGSSGKGLLYRITGPGRATVLYDFPGDEVKAIAAAPDGTIWAIANEYSEPPDIPKRTASTLRNPAGPATITPRPKPGKGQLWRFDPQGRPEKMMSHSEFHYMSLALDDAGTPYVGTGAEGRVYTVDDAHAVTLVADTDERQVTALSLAGLPKSAHRSERVHRVERRRRRCIAFSGKGGADAMWTSKVFDAGGRAHFGHDLVSRDGAAIEISTRTGNTDGARHDVERMVERHGDRRVRHEPVRALHPSPRAALATEHRAQRSRWCRSSPTTCARSSPTFRRNRNRFSARRRKDLPRAAAEPPKHDSTVHVTWKVENPDQDALRYRISYRREGDAAWRDMLRDERDRDEDGIRLGDGDAARRKISRARRSERRAREPARSNAQARARDERRPRRQHAARLRDARDERAALHARVVDGARPSRASTCRSTDAARKTNGARSHPPTASSTRSTRRSTPTFRASSHRARTSSPSARSMPPETTWCAKSWRNNAQSRARERHRCHVSRRRRVAISAFCAKMTMGTGRELSRCRAVFFDDDFDYASGRSRPCWPASWGAPRCQTRATTSARTRRSTRPMTAGAVSFRATRAVERTRSLLLLSMVDTPTSRRRRSRRAATCAVSIRIARPTRRARATATRATQPTNHAAWCSARTSRRRRRADPRAKEATAHRA